MDKQYLIKLSSGVYRTTQFFPEKEPLKFLIRQKAVDILIDSVLFFSEKSDFFTEKKTQILAGNILEKIDVIRTVFELAQAQNWVDEISFRILGNEYDKLAENVEIRVEEIEERTFIQQEQELANHRVQERVAESVEKKETSKPKQRTGDSVDNLKKPRHRKIIQILEKKGSAQIRDFKEVLPDVSKRTLRRDMDYLLTLGFVERKGDKNNTLYKMKSN